MGCCGDRTEACVPQISQMARMMGEGGVPQMREMRKGADADYADYADELREGRSIGLSSSVADADPIEAE